MPDPLNHKPANPARRLALGKLSTLGVMAATTATLTPVIPAFAKEAGAKPGPDRALSLRNIHTLEELEVTYWSNGNYIHEAVPVSYTHLTLPTICSV